MPRCSLDLLRSVPAVASRRMNEMSHDKQSNSAWLEERLVMNHTAYCVSDVSSGRQSKEASENTLANVAGRATATSRINSSILPGAVLCVVGSVCGRLNWDVVFGRMCFCSAVD